MQTPCPPQNQSILSGTPLPLSSAWLSIASRSVKRVSTVPWTIRVGARMREISGPVERSANQRTDSSEKRPPPVPSTAAVVMCGSVEPSSGPLGLSTPPVVAVFPTPVSSGAPARLDRLALVQAADEVVPRDQRHDRVHAPVDRGRDQLDRAAVAAAAHAGARVAGRVEPRLGLLGHVVEQRLDVAPLVVPVVDLHGAAGLAEAASVPGQHVVALGPQPSGRGRPVDVLLVGVARAAVAVADQDRRRALAVGQALGGEEVGGDPRAVERPHRHVPRRRGGLQGQREDGRDRPSQKSPHAADHRNARP